MREVPKRHPIRDVRQGDEENVRGSREEASVAVTYSFPFVSPLANQLNGATIGGAIMRSAACRFARAKRNRV